jgi:hypothetical protein
MQPRSRSHRHRLIATLPLAFLLAACGAGASPSSPSRSTPTPTPVPTPVPTPSPTPVPAPPLVVTAPCNGCLGTGGTAVQLTLVGEDGRVAATVDDPGGAYGNSYYVGSSDVYFIDGTTVKALARNGMVTVVGQVPQVKTTVTASDLQGYTSLAVSPDETTLVFGLPLASAGDNGATTSHSQLWTEPTGGTAASATMVFDDADNTVNGGEVLMPFAWSNTGISVSEMPKGLGGVGPFLTYHGFNAATFDPTTRTLHPLDCSVSTAPGSVCVTEQGDSTFKVVRSSGTETLTWQPANAEYGPVRVSADGRYLAYGAYVGECCGPSSYYVTTVVDLSTGATISTVRGFEPEEWLADDRLVVSDDFQAGATWLLSPAFTKPHKIAPNPPVGALA